MTTSMIMTIMMVMMLIILHAYPYINSLFVTVSSVVLYKSAFNF